jgi:hypothetical protein
MNETPKKKAQYSFHLSKEKLREFLSFSAEAKLEWLEEANRFVNEFLPSEKRKRVVIKSLKSASGNINEKNSLSTYRYNPLALSNY